LNEKKCSGTWIQQKYQHENCDTNWIDVENCEYGCEDGECKIKEICELGSKRCFNKELHECEYSYTLNMITWVIKEICESGCESEECKKGCEGGFINEYKCSGDWSQRKYQYSDCSSDWVMHEACKHGCSEDGKCNSEPQTTEITVSSVLDGDTIKLSSGENVRLIGINAPESGYPCSSEATNKLKEFVLGEQVSLEQDIDDSDQYGRLLRYVYVGNTFVNMELVRLGLAHKYEYSSNTKYSAQFEQAENEAKQNEGCLWKSEEINYIQDKCIYITNFHFNAARNDNYQLNDEYVSFGNKCPYSIDMRSWTVKDETASHIYTLPSFTFQQEEHSHYTLEQEQIQIPRYIGGEHQEIMPQSGIIMEIPYF